MIDFSAGICLELLLIRRVTVHRIFDIGTPQSEVVIADPTANA